MDYSCLFTADALTGDLKNELIVWVVVGALSLVPTLMGIVSLYDRFVHKKPLSLFGNHAPSSQYVTRFEFKPLVNRVDRLEQALFQLAETINRTTSDLVGELKEIKGILKGKNLIK